MSSVPSAHASSAWIEALSGAILALLLTVGIVAVLHGYLLKVPDVLLKLSAGVMLLAYGTFWLGEGVGLAWPGNDFALLGLVVFYGLASLVAIRLLRSRIFTRRDLMTILRYIVWSSEICYKILSRQNQEKITKYISALMHYLGFHCGKMNL